MPNTRRTDPLYLQARQHMLFTNDPSAARLQRALCIDHAQALALRDALVGDVLEHRCESDSWHIAATADRSTDYLLEAKITQAAQWLTEADGLLIAAGAGMGIDSGLPDFRGENGFWRAYPALGRERLSFTDIASPQAFTQRPATAWGFYGHRLQLYRATTPHAGFDILHRWSNGLAQGCFVLTSNVDGQFHRAGFPPVRIHECHGSIHGLQCSINCHDSIWSASELQPEVDEATCQWQGALPRCPHCGALARPNILMFDDWHWNPRHSAAQRDRLDEWLDHVHNPLVIEIGAGRAVATVRHFSQRMQKRSGRLIRINLHEANIHNPGAIELALGAREALEKIDTALQG